MKRYFLSNATRQFARVLHDSVTSKQRYSSSPAKAQQFFTIQKNPGDFLSHGTNANRSLIPAVCSMELPHGGETTAMVDWNGKHCTWSTTNSGRLFEMTGTWQA
ncbi:hypothetical protein [Bradyrhizobium forestalis]|uniref:hypothetical protein n=1 Tax=Bradyrhizobium forestalis TaxID=1419263 RepID=UPI001ABF4847|nr:hypothetical protein [Bradyrhizobium forestalis]